MRNAGLAGEAHSGRLHPASQTGLLPGVVSGFHEAIAAVKRKSHWCSAARKLTFPAFVPLVDLG